MSTLRLALAILFCAMGSLAYAELDVEVKKAAVRKVTTPHVEISLAVEDGSTIGQTIKSVGEPVVSVERDIAVLYVTSDRDLSDRNNTLVRIECDTTAPKAYGVGIFAVTEPGTHAIKVIVQGQNPLAWEEKRLTVTVGPTPPPVPPDPAPPGPGPSPPSPSDKFDGLAAKVNAHAVGLTVENRAKIAVALTTAADKMARFEFRQIKQASDFIARNWPACTSPHCGAIFKLVYEDAVKRNLSWQEAQEYYREVAKGVKP